MPLLSAADPLPRRPRRIAVAGASGSGKTTLAAATAELLGIPHVEIDALFHGPGWTTRPTFDRDVRDFVDGPAWVTEWQYDLARPLIAARVELLVWLDLSRWRVLRQVSSRTVRRRLRREVLWQGNVERPLWTVLTDPEHIVRWAWSTHQQNAQQVTALLTERPDLPVVRLTDRPSVQRWVTGPLADAAALAGGQ